MNRILVVLVVIQTVLIGAVILRFGALEAQTARIEKTLAAEIRAADNAPAPAFAPSSARTALSAEEYEALRAIVREEIDRLAAAIETPRGGAAEAPRSAQAPAMPPAEQARLYEEFENELASLRARGALTPGDMAALEQKIARMPPADRTRALSRLSREMSEGTINAKL